MEDCPLQQLMSICLWNCFRKPMYLWVYIGNFNLDLILFLAPRQWSHGSVVSNDQFYLCCYYFWTFLVCLILLSEHFYCGWQTLVLVYLEKYFSVWILFFSVYRIYCFWTSCFYCGLNCYLKHKELGQELILLSI